MKRKLLPIKEWIHFNTGTDLGYSIEHRLFNVTAYFGGVVGLLSVAINLIIDAPILVTLFAGFVTMVGWGTFYLSRFMNKFEAGRWILSTFMLLSLGFLFFINNGSMGPLLHLYLVFFLLLLFIWNGRSRIFFIGLFLLNITAFFIIELKFPGFIKPYDLERTRVLDVYLSFYLYIILGGVILMFAKNAYVKEKIKAEKSDKLKSAFLANMSHEIRTPMNAILGFTQLLHRENLSKSKREAFLQVIHDNSHSLLRLIEDIIDVSKIEAGELEIKEVDVDLRDLISKIATTYRLALKDYPEKNLTIIESVPPDMMYAKADNTRLNQVLLNLVSNAYKYTVEGSITIGYLREGDCLKFFVRDTGSGIKEEFIGEVFDRFRKIETEGSFNIQPGTGIGLSIAKNLVRLMGGELSVESEYGKGSEFFFTIPYHPSSLKMAVSEQKNPIVELGKIDFTGKLILIAEDERTNFEFLKKVLERTGAEIIHANNGKEAVRIVGENSNIDLVLMDIMMPEMNGYDASAAIKKKRSEIPIIAQTALAMEGDSKRVLDSGCDDYISKPIRISELMQKLCALLKTEESMDS